MASRQRIPGVVFTTKRNCACLLRGAEGQQRRLVRDRSASAALHRRLQDRHVNKTRATASSAYSDLGVLPDGTVLCLYEQGNAIACARFNLEWLLEAP
jgi:hypothetical protein